MRTPKTASDPNTAAKTTIVDGLRRRLSVEAACDSAGVQRRTAYNWRKADQRFDTAWAEAVEDAEHLVNRQQVADWRTELGRVESDLAEIEAAIGEEAAPAMAGDPDAIVRRDELRVRHQSVTETANALRQAIASGEGHIARQAAAKVEAAREAAAVESDALGAQQCEAAAKIDAALQVIEQAWTEFDAASKSRQSAARRSGGRARPAHDRMLIQAVFASAPATATAIGLDQRYRVRSRPLSETVGP